MSLTTRAATAVRPIWAGTAICAAFLAGCCTPHSPPPDPPAAARAAAPTAHPAADYTVVFPDVIELAVARRPDCPALVLVSPDGRIDLGRYGTVFAEGATAGELAARVAFATGAAAEDVQCQVAAARSRVVHLLGPGAGHPRAVPYAGPEHVSDLLRRAGGLPAGADASVVRVVRRNVARGTPTETFRVDLAAVRRGDPRTDVVVQPNDEVHVAEDSGVVLAGFFTDRTRP